MNYKLPVLTVLQEAFLRIKKDFSALLKLAVPLIIFGLAWVILVPGGALTLTTKMKDSQLGLGIIALVILLLFLLVRGIVGCHRIYLLGEQEKKKLRLFKGAGTELPFTLWWLLMVAAFIGVSIAYSLCVVVPINYMLVELNLSVPNWLVAFLFGLPVKYIFCRWSILLPAVAVGIKEVSLGWAWRLSRGNGLRLMVVLLPLPFAMNWLLGILPLGGSIVGAWMGWLCWLVVGAIQVGLVSISFNYLVTNVAIEQESASAT